MNLHTNLDLTFKLNFGNYILYLIKSQTSIFGMIILKILHILCRFGTFCKHFAITTSFVIFKMSLFMVYSNIFLHLPLYLP